MSKIFKPFIIFFRAIYRAIDKVIVTPISRLIYKINEIFRDNSGKIEKILNRPNVLIYVSLICAVGVFLLVDSQVITLTETDAKIIKDQSVEINYNEEAYVLEGIPENVDITLIGSKSAIYLATQLGEHKVTLDLSNYGVGTYKVDLRYNHSGEAVDYKLDPSTVTIKISEKVSEVKPLSYDLLNEDKLDSKLSISNIKLDNSEIIVKSSQEILDKVAVVKALVDASQIDTKDSGKFTIESATLVAYDELGNKLDNIEMVPSKVSAEVTVDSYHATKPVNIITTGEMKSGKAIASISSSVSEVEVYGEKSVVDAIDAIEASLDISTIDSEKSISVNLIKPNGVRYLSQSNTNVKISIGDQVQRKIEGLKVRQEGLGEGLSAGASSKDQTIDVIVKGVDSVVNKDISDTDIYAYVDLTGLKAGTHTVKVMARISDQRVTVQVVQTEITVKITQK
ncbi:MAG: CdaR family protein [Bacilli bacterium]|nr:CdaR family protein [Bacilli bacterium]